MLYQKKKLMHVVHLKKHSVPITDLAEAPNESPEQMAHATMRISVTPYTFFRPSLSPRQPKNSWPDNVPTSATPVTKLLTLFGSFPGLPILGSKQYKRPKSFETVVMQKRSQASVKKPMPAITMAVTWYHCVRAESSASSTSNAILNDVDLACFYVVWDWFKCLLHSYIHLLKKLVTQKWTCSPKFRRCEQEGDVTKKQNSLACGFINLDKVWHWLLYADILLALIKITRTF